MCTSTAQLREGKLHYGLGCSSLRIEYHYRNALACTYHEPNNETQHLKTAAQGHLGPQCQTPRYLHNQLQYILRARQYVSIHNSNLRLTLQGQPILTESFDSITKALWALGTQPAYSGNPNSPHCILSYGLRDLQPSKAT